MHHSVMRLRGRDYRYAEAVRLIDQELELFSASVVVHRKEQVLQLAKLTYQDTADYRGVRDAWEMVFPGGQYSKEGLAKALEQING